MLMAAAAISLRTAEPGLPARFDTGYYIRGKSREHLP